MLTTLDADENVTVDMLATDEFQDINVINYHVKILLDAGYIDGYYKEYNSGGASFYIRGLTWIGQDFAESMVSDSVWTKAHAKILGVLGTTTFEVVKEVCVKVSKELLGL